MTSPVLTFSNMKGGVGKTTLAVEISRTLAYHFDKHVLLIDYDPQANASLSFFGSSEYFALLRQGKSISHCLLPDAIPNDPFSVAGVTPMEPVDVANYAVNVRSWYYPKDRSRKAGRLDLIPGNLDLMRIALNVLPERVDAAIFTRWKQLVDSATSQYDCVVIDSHPAGSFFTKSALLISDAVIVPVTSDAFAALGLRMMRAHMSTWEPFGGASQYVVVFNDAHRNWDNSVEDQIRTDDRFAPHCVEQRVKYSTLHRNVARRQLTAAEQPVAHRRRTGFTMYVVTNQILEYLSEHGIEIADRSA